MAGCILFLATPFVLDVPRKTASSFKGLLLLVLFEVDIGRNCSYVRFN